LISAFVFGGIPEKAVKQAFAETELFVSTALLKEYRDASLSLVAKGKVTPLQFKALISGLAAFVNQTNIVYPRRRLYICRDPIDNMLLECCFEAKANFLITGDKDLFDIETLPFHLNILTLRKFIEK